MPSSLWSFFPEFIEQSEKKTSKIKISGGAISIGSSLLAITGMISNTGQNTKNFDIISRWEINVTGIILIPFRKDTNILIEKFNLNRTFETYIKLWGFYWNDNCWSEYGNHRWWIVNRLVLTLLRDGRLNSTRLKINLC